MKRRSHQEMLESLSDALVKDILNAYDDEILSEVSEEFGTSKAEADHVRELFERAQAMVAKKRLKAAREAIEKQKITPQRVKVIPLNPLEARRKLEALLNEYPEATRDFTLAARKGKDLSDADILSMLEDLQELGLYNPETESESEKK
jgi:6-pyruvoyl-tetrahydropterin synthase